MGGWKTGIRNQLIDVRGCVEPGNDRRQALLDGELVRLSTSHALGRDAFDALRIHQQHWARAYCVGLSMRKAVLTGRASAYLNDMWVANTPLDQVHAVLKSVPPRQAWPSGVVYIQRTLTEDQIRRGTAMSTTTTLQTFFDIARIDGFAHALVAADWLVKFGGYTPAQLQKLVELSPRFTGKPVARRAAACASTLPDSAPESYARGLLLAAGFTDVRANVTLTEWGYRVDLLIDGWLVIEIDGLVKYDDTTYGPAQEALLNEKKRADRIGNAGFPILRFSPSYLERHPDKFIATVRERWRRGR